MTTDGKLRIVRCHPTRLDALVAFVASELAGYLTGSNLSMNGGQHMR